MKRYTCRGCGAEIIFIRTPRGKSLPCDPEPVTYWESRLGTGRVVTKNGEVVSAELTGYGPAASGQGYIPHFATCPRADDFRRGR